MGGGGGGVNGKGGNTYTSQKYNSGLENLLSIVKGSEFVLAINVHGSSLYSLVWKKNYDEKSC